MSGQEQKVHAVYDEAELIESILSSEGAENVVQTTLTTDERVIARVTDGIYRQPGSALRELISNAYDADATRVVIKTDAPRFERISVEDNGHGMGAEALAHLLRHIGGSAKRNKSGSHLGITSSVDPTRSPEGRKLIGKIGIGLFSVSQLTHTFQIITKIKGDPFRTVAIVALRQYADESLTSTEAGEDRFESGKVNVWRERAVDCETHGTTIILTSIRPQAREALRSRDIWSVIEQNESLSKSEESQPILPPKYHIGRVDSSGALLQETGGHLSSLPWENGDAPEIAFRKLVDSVWGEVDRSTPNPQLDRIFDYYLRMIWQLSLAVPVPYVDGHLFDIDPSGWAGVYLLSNEPKGAARKIDANSNRSIRHEVELKDPIDDIGKFEVFFDELRLFRPIKFKDLPVTNNALKAPIIFIGKCREEFPKLPHSLSGGPLEFEAYLLWTPKVAPVEHQGALIRIHGSSGTLFDSTFMRYQVSELQRLRQITCEIFVNEGLDSALNIDRESFNAAHPHSVYITKWLHSALRQLASTQKRLASEARDQFRGESKGVAVSEIQRVASELWRQESDDPGASPPNIEFTNNDVKALGSSDTYLFSKSAIVVDKFQARTAKSKAQSEVLEEKLKAIAQVLASFGLLDTLPKRKQERLLRAIYEILESPGE